MEYVVTIGLELHAEVKTNRKVFSPSLNNYNEIPNINVSPIDLGLPGTLPVLDKESLKKAIKMAKCLNCEIPEYLMFDRKNYYYPDLPKGYQITQFNNPIGVHGKIKCSNVEHEIEVSIQDIHLEEDTASLDHYFDYSLLDYNRSGVPLIEIVTDPCLHSATDAVCYLEYLVNVFRYCDISEADTKKGQLRCDVNVSLNKPKDKKLGTRVEMKNINSFAIVYEAINYEIKRQSEILSAGGKVLQETRRYDTEKCMSIKMRDKADAIDYKYYPEPNIPVIKLDQNWLNEIFNEIPLLPYERKLKYINEYNLNNNDASILVKNLDIANYFEECLRLEITPKIASNWILSEIMGLLNKDYISIKDFFVKPVMLKSILNAIDDKRISGKQAKELLIKCYVENKTPEELFYLYKQNNNEDELETLIVNILNEHPNEVNLYKNGRNNLFDYFVGQVMKATKGSSNPVITKEILLRELKK